MCSNCCQGQGHAYCNHGNPRPKIEDPRHFLDRIEATDPYLTPKEKARLVRMARHGLGIDVEGISKLMENAVKAIKEVTG